MSIAIHWVYRKVDEVFPQNLTQCLVQYTDTENDRPCIWIYAPAIHLISICIICAAKFNVTVDKGDIFYMYMLCE